MKVIEVIMYASIYLGLIATFFYILSFFAGKKKKKELFSDEELPTVSVIIPAHNEERSIVATLKSILKSEYPKRKLEIIIVDDGSTDKTLEITKKLEGKNVRVFSKKRGGKGSALNFGIKKSRGEIIVSMDADTSVETYSLKEMIRYFKNKKVMCVAPSIITHKPKGILQKVQYIEYLTGFFLRKTFSLLNAVSVAPGAFSAYRKIFFDKYGGYDEGNITEDLELALRIQYNGYTIENAVDSVAYTLAPKKFFQLMKQRRRWYYGLIKNTWEYRKIFNPKYGDLGLFVFPIAWLSIFFCIIISIYTLFKMLLDIRKEILFLNSINYDFVSTIDLSFYAIERMLFLIITNPILIFIGIFIIIIGFYIRYASKRVRVFGVFSSLALFFIFFAMLFGFWWVVSFLYAIFNKRISWK